jgi:N-acylneuraminate cytidylyltransferase
LNVLQGINDKVSTLKEYLDEKGIPASEVAFIGNDVNDVGCFEITGFAVTPADAEIEVKRRADLVLTRRGGYGAVREFCDLILQTLDR